MAGAASYCGTAGIAGGCANVGGSNGNGVGCAIGGGAAAGAGCITVGDGVGTTTVGEPATGAAATTSSSAFAPIWIPSPPTRNTGPEIREPFTIVRPEDPRSSSTARPSWVGVRAAELADLRDPALVAETVANALGLRDVSSRWLVSTLTDFVATKRLLGAKTST